MSALRATIGTHSTASTSQADATSASLRVASRGLPNRLIVWSLSTARALPASSRRQDALVVTAATKAITRPSITQQFFENLVTWLPMLLLLVCTAIYYPLATALLVLTMLLLHFVFTPKTTTPSQTASDSPFSMGEAAVAERLAHEGSGGKRKASQQKRKVGHKPPTWRQLEAEELIIRKVQLPPSIGSGGGGGAASKVAMKAHLSVIMMLAMCVPATAFSCTPHVKPSQRSLLSPRMMAELGTEKWDVERRQHPI